MKQNKTKFGRGTSLKDALKEMEDNGMTEITRVMKINDVWFFEYNTE